MKKPLIPQIIITIMLLFALRDANPYSYYVILRVVCCAVFLYILVFSIQHKFNEVSWLSGILAFVYNPIFLIRLNRSTWELVNIATIILVVFITIKLHKKEATQ